LIFAFPLGLAIAIFLSDDVIPLPIRQFVRFTVEMLAAIPSVVYGLWGIFVVIPLVQGFGSWATTAFKNIPILNTIFAPPAYGNSMLTASLVLALMILPTITAISRSALVAVPGTLREGAYALGSTRWEAIFGVILPTAAPASSRRRSWLSDGPWERPWLWPCSIGNSSRLTWSLLASRNPGRLAGQSIRRGGRARGEFAYVRRSSWLFLTLFVNMAGEAVLRYTQRKTAGIR
jgi:phosphate transport system permease protein